LVEKKKTPLRSPVPNETWESIREALDLLKGRREEGIKLFKKRTNLSQTVDRLIVNSPRARGAHISTDLRCFEE